MTTPLTAQNLLVPGVVHGFFTREGGVSTGIYASLNCGLGSADAPEAVAENRARVVARLGLGQGALATCHQVHSPDVAVVDRPFAAGERPRADALVTATPGLAIGVATADCGPLLFADPAAGVIGAAHAGWRGALDGVAEATIDAMERLGAARGRIAVGLGMMIRQESYEVDESFRARFVASSEDWESFFAPGRPGRWQFDLPGYLAERLRRAGVGSICDVRRCTYAEPEAFFSYRRSTHRDESDYGRHLSVIALSL
jgi:YfiH family protein